MKIHLTKEGTDFMFVQKYTVKVYRAKKTYFVTNVIQDNGNEKLKWQKHPFYFFAGRWRCFFLINVVENLIGIQKSKCLLIFSVKYTQKIEV